MSDPIFGNTDSGAVELAREWVDRHLGGTDLLSLAPQAALALPAGDRIALERRISGELEAGARSRFGKRPAARMRRELAALAAVLAVLAFHGARAERAEAVFTPSWAAGELTLAGTADAEVAVVTCNANTVRVNGVDVGGSNCALTTKITGTALAGDDRIDLAGVTAAAGFTNPNLNANIILTGGDGNDTLIGSPTYGTKITGDAGNDAISGGNANDTLEGNAGSDTISGGGGNDAIAGGDDADNLSGGDGNDTITDGGGAVDTLSGDGGDDVLTSADGADPVAGGDGNDTITRTGSGGSSSGGAGNDSIDASGTTSSQAINGGSGGDILRGGSAADNISGEDDSDQIFGGAGADTLNGGLGNDTIDGQADADTIFGDFGDDSLIGGAAADTLTGHCGNDVFSTSGDGANDTLRTGLGTDNTTAKDPTDVLQTEPAVNCAAVPAGGGTTPPVVPPSSNPNSGGGGTGSTTPGSTIGFSKAYLTNTVFSVAGEPTPRVLASQAARGTTIVYTLQKNTKVTIDIAQRVAGLRGVSNRGTCASRSAIVLRRSLARRLSRRIRGKARERRLAQGIRARRCNRARHVGSLHRSGTAGANRVPFSGRLDSTALKVGRYQLVLRGTDSDGTTVPNVRLFFRIVR